MEKSAVLSITLLLSSAVAFAGEEIIFRPISQSDTRFDESVAYGTLEPDKIKAIQEEVATFLKSSSIDLAEIDGYINELTRQIESIIPLQRVILNKLVAQLEEKKKAIKVQEAQDALDAIASAQDDVPALIDLNTSGLPTTQILQETTAPESLTAETEQAPVEPATVSVPDLSASVSGVTGDAKVALAQFKTQYDAAKAKEVAKSALVAQYKKEVADLTSKATAEKDEAKKAALETELSHKKSDLLQATVDHQEITKTVAEFDKVIGSKINAGCDVL